MISRREQGVGFASRMRMAMTLAVRQSAAPRARVAPAVATWPGAAAALPARGPQSVTSSLDPPAASAIVGRRTPSVTAPAKLHADLLQPNVMSVRHWTRLLDGALVAVSTRIDWSTLLMRTFEIDVLACASCGGRLRILGSVTEPDAVRRILEMLAIPTDAPRVARARDPTDVEPRRR